MCSFKTEPISEYLLILSHVHFINMGNCDCHSMLLVLDLSSPCLKTVHCSVQNQVKVQFRFVCTVTKVIIMMKFVSWTGTLTDIWVPINTKLYFGNITGYQWHKSLLQTLKWLLDISNWSLLVKLIKILTYCSVIQSIIPLCRQ